MRGLVDRIWAWIRAGAREWVDIIGDMNIGRAWRKLVAVGISIIVAVLIIGLILMAIPTSRLAIMTALPGPIMSMIPTSVVSSFIKGSLDKLDPKAIAEIINDDETRGVLVKVINGMLVELDPEATASLINDDETRDNLVDLINKVLPETEPYAIADLINRIVGTTDARGKWVANPALVNLLLDTGGREGLISQLEPAAIADLINKLTASGELVDFTNSLIAELSKPEIAANLGGFLGEVIANEKLDDLINGVISELDGDDLAELLGPVLSNPDTAKLVNAILANAELTGPKGAIGKLINAIEDTLTEDMFQYLWIGFRLETISVLGSSANPLIQMLLNELAGFINIEGWIRVIDLYYGPQMPYPAPESPFP